jgi:hypothetical protein
MPTASRLAAALAALAVSALPALASDAESELSFVDLRLHGGVNATNGHGGGLTLMCGDIGDKDQHVVDTWRDIGVVVGLRFEGEHVKVKLDGGPTLQENVLEGDIVGGLGIFVDQEDLLEIVVGYGLGEHSDGTRSGFHKRGSTRKLLGEVGWHHTFSKHWQVGALIGYEIVTMKFTDVPVEVKGKAQGVNAAISFGYRF